MNNSYNGSFKTAMFADCLANSKEIFQLIDRVFPVDSCRHYELLPLKLNGNNLVLGMLKPEKEESLRFVNSIVKVFKYNLEIQLIDLQTHQIILANYPQNSSQSNRSEPEERDRNKTIIDRSFDPSIHGTNHRRIVDSAPTIISHSEVTPVNKNINQPNPKLPDLPPDLDFLKDLELTPKPKENVAKAKPKPDSTATLFEIPPEFMNQSVDNLDEKATVIGGNPAELLAQTSTEDSEIASEEAQISQLIAETLGKASSEIELQRQDFLPELLPQLSWQKLLEQAFYHRSDYLKLTRYSDRGAVVAEQNKEIQSTLDRIALPIFCSLIDEIKRMARLPQNTANHPKKVVLERFYEEERILLRLEFSTQARLEEVGIQILRDRALITYEQQQMDRVSDRALQLAQELEKTLRRIQACFDSAQMNNLTELQTVHSRINHQLRLLDKKG